MGKKLQYVLSHNIGFRAAQGDEIYSFKFIAYHLAKKVGSTKLHPDDAYKDCMTQLEEYYETVYKVLNPICEAIENPNGEDEDEGWTDEGGEDEEG